MARTPWRLIACALVVLCALYAQAHLQSHSHRRHGAVLVQEVQQRAVARAALSNATDHEEVERSSHHHRKHKKKKHHHHKKKKIPVSPKRGKAGIAGTQSLKWIGHRLGWYYDWSPRPEGHGHGHHAAKASMLWGIGWTQGRWDNRGDHDGLRFNSFKNIRPGKYKYVLGFNEPDFQGRGSSGYIPPKTAAQKWDRWIGPHKKAGSIVVSPSMAKQRDEDWMAPFLRHVRHKPDAIAVHIFQNKPSKIRPVLNHFAKYKLPMYVSEFACIDYQNGANAPCNQRQTDHFIRKAVKIFEHDHRVAAYSLSDAYNGPYSALTPNHNGQRLSQTGRVYRRAIKKYHRRKRALEEEREVAPNDDEDEADIDIIDEAEEAAENAALDEDDLDLDELEPDDDDEDDDDLDEDDEEESDE